MSHKILGHAYYVASKERRMELELTEMVNEQYGLSKFPENTSEAMAYVPFQKNNAPTYTPAQGFSAGTMFPTLNKQFYGSKCGGSND